LLGILKKIKNKILKTKHSVHDLTISETIRSNNIFSSAVSLDCIRGENIEIRENTSIDKNSSIGDYTYIGLNTTITKSIIGRYCSIGNNVSIGPGEHDLEMISTSAFFYADPNILTEKDCIIGNDVWIGVDSIIKRGISIGNGAVVGANSVVTKDVPAYAIVAGSPAKILRYRFNEEIIDILQNSAWWEYDLEEAKNVQEKLKNRIADCSQ